MRKLSIILLVIYTVLTTYSMWITHDLGIVAGLAQRVIVIYGGYIIEEAPVRELYANPTHPFTIGLLGSLPRANESTRERLFSIEGQPPVLLPKAQCLSFCSPLQMGVGTLLAGESAFDGSRT